MILDYDNDAEHTVIATLKDNPDCLPEFIGKLNTPDLFYSFKNKKIFNEIVKLTNNGDEVNDVILYERLDNKKGISNVGAYLQTLSSYSTTPYLLPQYIGILKDKHAKRKVVEIAETAKKIAAGSETGIEVIKYMQEEILKLTDENDNNDSNELNVLTHKTLNEIFDASNKLL